jgi:glycerate 2-kinase
VQPIPPLVLADLIATNEVLLASGAQIDEINTVRKHLDSVKGGGLIRIARGRPFVALILSDVIGDDPVTIGSGPASADPTTFADALDILERHRLRRLLPPAVVQLLEAGVRGEVPETLKPDEEELAGVANVVIGSNRDALEAAGVAARRAGYEPVIADRPLVGDTTEAAQVFTTWVLRQREGTNRPLCLLAGGETTVRLGDSPGRGGRNQEFGLACARALAGRGIDLLSAGTDGVDGPTDAAGAWVDGSTLERARKLGLSDAAALAAHDSYAFFDALGDLFRPGPTGTNVMDIKIALIGKPS